MTEVTSMASYWSGRSIGYWAADFTVATVVMIIFGSIGFFFGTLASIVALAGLLAVIYMRQSRINIYGGPARAELRAAQLVILDEKGRPRSCLDSSGLQFLDDQGKRRLLVAVDADGPAIQILDDSQKVQINLGSSALDGSYGLSLIDEAGKIRGRAIMRKELQGIASFALYDKLGQLRANLALDGSGPAILNLLDETGLVSWRASDVTLTKHP
jgi:hypothetical protein